MSEIRVTTISDTAGTGPVTLTKQSAAKAWCNADATGTAVIDGSFNTSSITDVGTGQYTLNWTNAFSNGNYSHSGTDYFYGLLSTNPHTYATTSANIFTYNNSFAVRDSAFNTSAHGDLA